MIDCLKCQHYYVTWDKDFPHGCKGMGFKSRHLPVFAVRRSTPNMPCQFFQKKNAPRGLSSKAGRASSCNDPVLISQKRRFKGAKAGL